MNNEFFRVKGRRAGFDKSPFEAVLSRKSVLYAVRNDDGSLYALIDGPLGEVNLTVFNHRIAGVDEALFKTEIRKYQYLSGL